MKNKPSKSKKKKPLHMRLWEYFHLEHWQVISIGLLVYDYIAVVCSYFFALWIRFDCRYTEIPGDYFSAWLIFAPFYAIISVIIFWRFRLYNSIWRFASYSELLRTAAANVCTFLIHTIGITLFIRRMPLSYYVFGAATQFALVIGIRFSYRFILLERKRRADKSHAVPGSRVMLIGAGAAGRMILQDLNSNKKSSDRVFCIIDDNPNKWNRFIEGVPVVGGREDILLNVEKYKIEKIYFAIPSASATEKKEILNICQETNCELKTLPGVYQLVTGEVTVSTMKDVSVEDLLGREPIRTDLKEICEYIENKVILVTGGGGSIGSELCRQIASNQPKQLIIFDIYENNAYSIEQELKKTYPDLNLVVLIGSVRDSRRINYVFETYHPDVVYHAAAHKHVPLMETSPCEAIKNNAIGTYKTAYAAMIHGCKRFVLISTDKAVNPTNIMGASKRLCEMVIQTFDHMVRTGKAHLLPVLHGHADDEGVDTALPKAIVPAPITEYVAVRFGNVLGSNGSVIPLFKSQIEKGGPVTVTHPDIIRYFMTIPEAVSLVLLAGTYAKNGEIFVLDMGSPVKIDTLARNLIKLSGFIPDVDIKIEYTGLRPGEKLYEEKLMAEEGLTKTPNDLIHIGKPIAFDNEHFLIQLEGLMHAANNNQADICQRVSEIVTTYQPSI